jgi:putative radical SAM enzyme (TIGR03279 family)
VEPDSVAARLGLQPGDELLRVNGHELRDVIDVQFYGAEDWLELVVRRAGDVEGRAITTERASGELLGLDFAHPTFDVDIRRCRNNCRFCFLAQNPRGLRQSLYLKDDDYRYSFLYGNFVTLTNLGREDWTRLEEQRLSPLYVSVHATELELRRQMLQRFDAPDVIVQLRRLAEIGIEVHCQLVLVPGFNDGPHLERSLADLAELASAPVLSVGVVPVGLTRYHRGPFRSYRSEEMARVLEQITPWQARFRREHGVGWVYPSDEWYLALGHDVPPAAEYDGYPQIENGVGMVRRLLEEWKSQMADCRLQIADREWQMASGRRQTAVLICGTLIAPIIVQLMDEMTALTGLRVKVLPVVNQFFGPTVTVSGLLAGQDVVATVKEHTLEGPVFLPRAMFDAAGERTLDDWTLKAVEDVLEVPVIVAESLKEVAARLVMGGGGAPRVSEQILNRFPTRF